MNRGSTNKQQVNPPNNSNNQLPKKKKVFDNWFNWFFIIILLVFWGASGFYYPMGNQIALVFQGDKIIEAHDSASLHYAYPIPFNYVEVLDNTPVALAVQQNVELLPNQTYQIKSNGKFNIIDYNQYTTSLLRTSDEQIKSIVNAVVVSNISKYFAINSFDSVSQLNTIVLSTEIKDKINVELANYGLSLTEFGITDITVLKTLVAQNKTADVINESESVTIDSFRSVDRERVFTR